MTLRYEIHPSVGIARVGNSPAFYLAPAEAGGLPIACDEDGSVLRNADGSAQPVTQFKDKDGIMRQAARFSVYAHDDERGTREEVHAGDRGIASITWTVHMANKKAAWYKFSVRSGDLTLGPGNSYEARKIPLRNPVPEAERQAWIIDPGPRTLAGAKQRAAFDAVTKDVYAHCSFPPAGAERSGQNQITTLGEARTDADGRLIVIGASGATAGPPPKDAVFRFQAAVAETELMTPAESDVVDVLPVGGSLKNDEADWFDDVADGPVTCTITFTDAATQPLELRAWCIAGPPKFAPEFVSAVTLDDVMMHVAVEKFDALSLGPAGGAPPNDGVANFERDIAPILERAAQAMWPLSTASGGLAYPTFDVRDPSPALRERRTRYAERFRRDERAFFDAHGVPLYPLQAGEDLVVDRNASFGTLTATQLRLLDLWAQGRFSNDPAPPLPGVDDLDRASVVNCVGAPMDPGVEATWTLRDPAIYERPWRIKHRHPITYYLEHGLSPSENEQDGDGCEPGDLTKRLVPPWQFDLQECGTVAVSVNDGKFGAMESPPRYTATWWPAQRPINVTLDIESTHGSGKCAGDADVWFTNDAGTKYPNDAECFLSMWPTLGFVLNANRVDGKDYPYFVQVEKQQLS